MWFLILGFLRVLLLDSILQQLPNSASVCWGSVTRETVSVLEWKLWGHEDELVLATQEYAAVWNGLEKHMDWFKREAKGHGIQRGEICVKQCIREVAEQHMEGGEFGG